MPDCYVRPDAPSGSLLAPSRSGESLMTLSTILLPKVTVVVAASYRAETAGGDQADGPRDHGTELVIEPVVAGDVGQAWNRGARRGRGELLLFLRDATPAARSIVTAHVDLHSRHAQTLGLSLVGGENGASEPRPVDFCGQTCSIRRTEFLGAGGFLEGLAWGTEAEFAHRMAAHGLRLRRVDGAPTPRPTSLPELAAERAAAGRGSVALHRLRPELLPELELARFGDATPRTAALQRMLLALGAPLWPVRLGSRLVPRRRRASWERFVHSYLYWRGVWQAVTDRETRAQILHPPLILMYHAIGAPGEPAGRYVLPVRRFRAQLRWLRRAGYRVLALTEILECRRAYRFPPARAVILTFDDGYQDNHRVALPELRRHRAGATVFLVSGRIGEANRWDQTGELAGRPLMSWAEIVDLVEGGMEIGAHSRTHPALPAVPAATREDEIRGSRADLEARLGRDVRVFAYPYGLVDDATMRVVEAAGFDAACAVRSGANDPAVSRFLLRRLEIRGTDTLLAFALTLERRSRRSPPRSH